MTGLFLSVVMVGQFGEVSNEAMEAHAALVARRQQDRKNREALAAAEAEIRMQRFRQQQVAKAMQERYARKQRLTERKTRSRSYSTSSTSMMAMAARRQASMHQSVNLSRVFRGR